MSERRLLEIIATNIRVYRARNRIGQYEFAKKSRVSQSTIAQIEQLKKCPSLKTIVAIATVMKIQPAALLGKEE